MIQRRDLQRATRSRSPRSRSPRSRSLWGRSLWGLAAASLLAGLIGCGGGGDDDNNNNNTSTTGTATATGGDVATINIPNAPGTLSFSFLTGAGRAPGDRTLTVRRLAATDANGVVETRLQGERRLVLNRYSSQILDLNVPTLGRPSREFTNVQLDALQFETQDTNDLSGLVTYTYSPVVNLPVDLPSSVRVFPGRTVHVPFYLDTDVVTSDGIDPNAGGTATFSLTSFQAINFRPARRRRSRGRSPTTWRSTSRRSARAPSRSSRTATRRRACTSRATATRSRTATRTRAPR